MIKTSNESRKKYLANRKMKLKLYKKIWQGEEGCSDSFSDFAQQAPSHSWLDSAKCCSTRILPRNLISNFKAHIFSQLPDAAYLH